MNEPYINYIDNDNAEVVSIPNPDYNPVIDNPELYSKLLEISGIPSDYWDKSFEDYQGEVSKDELLKAKQYSNQFTDPKFDSKSLYLFGPNRTQKTMIMCAVGKEQIKANRKVIYFQVNQLQNILLNQINFNPDKQYRNTYDKIRNGYFDLILIDDIFSSVKQFMWKDGKGDYIISMWDEFFRNAFQNGQKIILTSNTRMNEIQHFFSKDLQELLNDYMYELVFVDSIKEQKRKWKEEVWDN